uniref:Uncharacterized protein n=1 Tax=Ciona savignyi TaxID=51511 RepID=H2YNR5_CIOSA
MLDSVKRPRLSPILVKSRTEKNYLVHKIQSHENDSVFLSHTDTSASDIPEPDSPRGQINIIEDIPKDSTEPEGHISAHIEQTSHHEFVTNETTVYEDIAKDNVETELNISLHIEQPDHQEHSTKETTFYSVDKSKSLMEVEPAEDSKKSENCNRIVLQARKFLETFKTNKLVKTNNNPPKVVQNDQVTKPPKGFKGYKLEPHFPPQSAGGRKYRTMMGETNRIASNLAQWRFNLENRLQLYSSH